MSNLYKDGERQTCITYRYTGFAKWPDGTVEEVDVDCHRPHEDLARRLVEQELTRNYVQGWILTRVERRYGFYM